MKNKLYKSTRVFSSLLKLFAFILIIKASFLVSFAFIGDELGLDLYKKIDSGVIELNNKMYSYELKGAKSNGKISDKINKILLLNGLSHCKIVENITEDDVYNISFGEKENVEKSGNLGLLSKKIEGVCSKIEDLIKVQNLIKDISINSKKIAKEKSDEIYQISKQGLFSDGNIHNSPFDIVKDIKDIDYIIFTQDVKYRGEQNIGDNDLGDFLNGELNNLENKLNSEADKIEDKITGKKQKNPNIVTDEEARRQILAEENNYTNNSLIGETGDNTKYSCPDSEDESGLSVDSLAEIKNNSNSNPKDFLNSNYRDYIHNGPINSNYRPLSSSPFSFSTAGFSNLGGGYDTVNDNDFFGCDTFFCITVEIITHNGNGLIGGTTRSIQSILERSNNHLKKFVNGSLVQSKMTTNNFELGLRDLNLSEMLSMPVVITKKTPPILDLDYFNNEVKKNNPNPLSLDKLIKTRFESLGMNKKRENDLSIYLDKNSELKNIANNAELNIAKIRTNTFKREEEIALNRKIDDHITRVINSNYQELETNGLYKEFVELEGISKEIQDYSTQLSKITDNMLKIPIHP